MGSYLPLCRGVRYAWRGKRITVTVNKVVSHSATASSCVVVKRLLRGKGGDVYIIRLMDLKQPRLVLWKLKLRFKNSLIKYLSTERWKDRCWMRVCWADSLASKWGPRRDDLSLANCIIHADKNWRGMTLNFLWCERSQQNSTVFLVSFFLWIVLNLERLFRMAFI